MGSTDAISETSMCRVLDVEFPSRQSCPREELQLDCGFCYSYSLSLFRSTRGVTKRCHLSWLTNSALVYEPKSGVST